MEQFSCEGEVINKFHVLYEIRWFINEFTMRPPSYISNVIKQRRLSRTGLVARRVKRGNALNTM
jgi:hypothetical protein